MGQSVGMLDFFVLEAGEYLERLDALAQTPAGPFPDSEEFVRIARAFRGSALMASQRAMARGAQGLEALGRSVRDARVAWDERVRGAVVRAVDECKKYLHRIRTPAPDDAAKAEELGAELERLAGRTSGRARAAGEGLDAGARAFVAREAAAIASTLDRTAQALAADPAGRDALAAVAPAMSALRGVAILNDLPPLADILVAVEGAVKEVLSTSGAVGTAVPAAFDAAAKALARAAREVVDLGRPDPDSEQSGAFASLLLGAFAAAGTVRPIEQLFYDDAGPHIVLQGAAPAPLSSVELVSQGEFLERAAEELSRAASPTLLDLRLFGMAASLRPLGGAGGSPLSVALGRAADAGRAAIDRGAASDRIGKFSTAIAEMARALREAVTTEEIAVAARLDAVAGQLEALTPASAAQAPAPEESQPTLAAVVAPSPGFRRDTTATAPAESIEAGPDLASGYATLERLIAERGMPMGSLAELLGAPEEPRRIPAAVVAPPPGSRPDTSATAPTSVEPEVVPIESLAPDEGQRTPAAVVAPPAGWRPEASVTAPDEEAVPIESLAPSAAAREEGVIVPIENLLYAGPSALKRALELKAELAALAAGPGTVSPRLLDLQREVFDLVELGLRAQL